MHHRCSKRKLTLFCWKKKHKTTLLTLSRTWNNYFADQVWFILKQSRAPSMGWVQGAGWPCWGSWEGRRNWGSQRQHTPFVGGEGNPGSWVQYYASGKMHWLPASGLPPEQALVLWGTAFLSYKDQSVLTSRHFIFTSPARILWPVSIPR